MNIEKEIKDFFKKVLKKLNLTGHQLNLAASGDRRFGDFSSNIALILAQEKGQPAKTLASHIQQALQEELEHSTLKAKIAKLEVKGAGFINIFLSQACLFEVLWQISRDKDNFGRVNLGQGRRVHLEFVSANPTGPLNVAHGRQAAFGDSLANLLEFSGFRVFREYYLNDEGVQIDSLGECLRVKYWQLLGESAQFPASGYRGRYIDDLAEMLVRRYKRRLLERKTAKAVFSRFGTSQILQGIKKDLQAFGVDFDCWFSQRRLIKTGQVQRALEFLKKKHFLYQKQGAWWLATSQFGDDKDRVVIKSDGNLTYIAPDIAYHKTKFKRRFSQLVNIWGPDHHGYIGRLKAAVSALGYDVGQLKVLIVQLVSLTRQDQVIPMSTRLGQYISLHDIIQAVGKDAARFFFLMRKREAHLHFDLELAKKQSLENPVYYIQYAHARILNILKHAQATKNATVKRAAVLSL